jgi:glyoxylase-like metal-dependent hydrolase (beta-lactamase superfamily II)
MFTRIAVPTPFQVGRLNAYLAGRTLVDTGPDSEEAWSALLDGLDAAGTRPEEIERVVVTHPHPDHFGLAARLREAGASVVASPAAAEIMADFAGYLRREQDFFREYFQRCGLSAETAATVTNLPEAFLAYAPSVETDRELDSGESVTVADTAVTADAVEGHAPGELIYAYRQDGQHRALVGDHVLGHITPNPLLQVPVDGGERPRMLPAFNRSLQRLREADYDHFLPGHGDPIERPTERIDEVLAAHEQRTEQVASLVDGPTTPADVMHGLFEDLPATEQFSGMSEAVGHLDVLEERGAVTKRESGDIFVYEPA